MICRTDSLRDIKFYTAGYLGRIRKAFFQKEKCLGPEVVNKSEGSKEKGVLFSYN